ncbi:MAG: hypothetical protein WD971_04600 [Pirellulales bacterium]
MNRHFGSFRVGLCALTLAVGAANALADVPTFISNEGRLPAPDFPYQFVDPPADFGGGALVTVYSLQLQAADPAQVEYPTMDFVNDVWLLDSFFDINYEMQMSIGLGPVFPVFGAGQMHVQGSAPAGLDSFTTEFQLELLQLDLLPSAVADPLSEILLRESPMLASTGVTTVVDLCPFCDAFHWRMTSFFDVFAEISIDGGANWVPSDGSFRIVQGIPEPGTCFLATLLIALLATPLAGRARRRK